LIKKLILKIYLINFQCNIYNILKITVCNYYYFFNLLYFRCFLEKNNNMITTNKIIKNTHKTGLLLIFIFFTILTYLSSDNFFFWDTVQLGSRHAHFFYENNFNNLLLPDNIDSGHIPTFGMYLAFLWIIFGKTLLISHFAILPFTLGIVFQLYLLIRRFISEKYIFPALILVLADPTLLSQSILVTPDIPLVFFFLLALNSVFGNRKILLSIAITGLFLSSMRGMMVSVALLIIDIYTNIKFADLKETFIKLAKRSIIYYPALVIFLSYNLYHYYVKSWIGYHENSPWAESFERVGFSGFLKNIVIFVWRMLDFGRVFLWFAAFFVGVKVFKSIKSDKIIFNLAFVFVVVSISLSISFLTYKYLNGHRYILPLYMIFAVIVSYLIFEKLTNEKLKYIVFSVALSGLLSGNLWVYPDKISQGWDSTLAHVHYYKLHEKLSNFIKNKGIKKYEVGSFFPNVTSDKFIYLNNDTSSYKEADIKKDKYIFYSNIFNIPDEDIDKLKRNFTEIKKYKNFGIYVVLYAPK